jgi:hypothetical protein
MKTCLLVEAFSIGYITDDLLFMRAFYSITSYPTVKTNWRINVPWVSVSHSATEHDQETVIAVIGDSDLCGWNHDQ